VTAKTREITARDRGNLTAHLIRLADHCGINAGYVATTSLGIAVVHLYDQDGARVDAAEALDYLRALAGSVGAPFVAAPPLIRGTDGTTSITHAIYMFEITWAVSVIIRGDQS
jgi:hypothetical protein